tara:strand:- start:243 stop:1925 length:1683 start_codon:yes stop_codon:yes gene_type:complete
MGCGTNIVPGFDAVNKQIKDYPLEMKIMAEFNASESNKKDYSKEAEKIKREAERMARREIKNRTKTIQPSFGPLKGKALREHNKKKSESKRIQDEYQRMMNIDVELMQGDIDQAALNALGNDLGPMMTESVQDAPGNGIRAMGEDRYYWFLYGGTREGVLDSMLGWGRPTAVIWFNEASGRYTSLYSPVIDAIVIRNYSKVLGNRRPLLGSILKTHLHETFHWADYTLGRHIYNKTRSDSAPFALSHLDVPFQLAFFEDARSLGITADKYGGPLNENQFEGEGRNRTRVGHDNALAEIIFYEYMLDHPRTYERIVKELKEYQEMLAEAGASYAFNPQDEMSKILKDIHIPNKRSETLKHLYGTQWMTDDGSVHSTMNQFIFDSEVTYRLGNNLPSRNEMMDYIESANKRMTDAIAMENVFEARDKLFKEVDKEKKALGDRRSELDGYMDILDAMSGGDARTNYDLTGHSESYYNDDRAESKYGEGELQRRRYSETFAQLGAAWANVDRADWNRMKEKLPNLTREFERIMEENKDAIIEPRFKDASQAIDELGEKLRSGLI